MCFCANSSPTTVSLTSSATCLNVLLRSQEVCSSEAEVQPESPSSSGSVQNFVALMSQSFDRSISKLKPSYGGMGYGDKLRPMERISFIRPPNKKAPQKNELVGSEAHEYLGS